MQVKGQQHSSTYKERRKEKNVRFFFFDGLIEEKEREYWNL